MSFLAKILPWIVAKSTRIPISGLLLVVIAYLLFGHELAMRVWELTISHTAL